MEQNLFYPIYKQLEKEFIDLSYYITFDRKQKSTYSTKIADMLLRTVSEIENLSKELCKKENIKFLDKKNHVRKTVYFNEYFIRLENVYGLSNKLVNLILENCNKNIIDAKLRPFQKDMNIKNKDNEYKIWKWYFAYNKIKHDRVKNFRQANLENLLNSLAALFLLNVYYMDKIFYRDDNDIDKIIEQIESFSTVFVIDYTLDVNKYSENKDLDLSTFDNSFFNPVSFFEIARKYSVYTIYRNYKIKTDSDYGKDFLEKLESSVNIKNLETGEMKRKYENFNFSNTMTECALVAKINKLI